MSRARPVLASVAKAFVFLLVVIGTSAPALAFEVPHHHGHDEREFQHPDLWWGSVYRPVHDLPVSLADELLPGLNQLGVQPEHAFFDRRSGRWGTLIITRPMIPGPGVGNDLNWSDLGRSTPENSEQLAQAAWQAFQC